MKISEIHNYLKNLNVQFELNGDTKFKKEQEIVNKLIKDYKLDGAILRGVSAGYQPLYFFVGAKENLEAMLHEYLGEVDIDPIFGPFKMDKPNKWYTEFTIEA
jgi:hypothetical protein